MREITSIEFKSKLLTEAQVSLGLTIPLALAQLAQMAIPAVNSVMMGTLGTQNLAVGALGVVTYISLVVISYGILTAGTALAAEAFGAKNLDILSRITCQGLWLAGTISLPAMVLLWNYDAILPLLGQEESNILLAKSYVRALVWGLPAMVGFLYLKRIATAIDFPQLGLVIIVASLLLNVPVNYALMFGFLGFPALGLTGIGWGTSLIYWATFLASVGIISFHPKTRDYQLFRYWDRFDLELFNKIFQLGWPTGIQWGMELGLFAVTAWLMGRLGTETLAAHEIAFQTSEIFLAIPLAISNTATARVGQLMGEKNQKDAMRATFVNMVLSALFAFVVAIGFELFSQPIAAIYLDISNPDNALAIERATSFLKIAGIYQVFYGIQQIGVGALLGLQDTRAAMLISTLAFWGVGVGGGYLMAIVLGWGGIGLWYGLTMAPAISSVILIVRFYFVNLRGITELEKTDEGDRLLATKFSENRAENAAS